MATEVNNGTDEEIKEKDEKKEQTNESSDKINDENKNTDEATAENDNGEKEMEKLSEGNFHSGLVYWFKRPTRGAQEIATKLSCANILGMIAHIPECNVCLSHIALI